MIDAANPGSADVEPPVVMVLPYLWLDQVYEFGLVDGPAALFPGPWNPPELEATARLLLSKYVTVTGVPVTNPAIEADHGVGAGGHPGRATVDAVRLAVGFGVLCLNPT